MQQFEQSLFPSTTLTVRLVSDDELADPVFLADVKAFASKLRIPRRRFVDWLADGYRDSETDLIDENGHSAFVDFEALEQDSVELWLKDWLKQPERHVVPRLRTEARERVRAVATLLRVIFPKESAVWGRSLPVPLVA